MIFYKGRENRLYLNTWDYNRCRIMTALEGLVKEAGGKVKRCGTAVISNRNIDPDKTITVTQPGYITFVYNDMMYSYNTDENPFFDFHYAKTPVINGRYSRDIYYEKDNDRVYTSDNVYYGLSEIDENEIKARAKQLFDFLLNAPISRKVPRKWHCVRVSNVYDGGSHMEKIYDEERFERVWED